MCSHDDLRDEIHIVQQQLVSFGDRLGQVEQRITNGIISKQELITLLNESDVRDRLMDSVGAAIRQGIHDALSIKRVLGALTFIAGLLAVIDKILNVVGKWF